MSYLQLELPPELHGVPFNVLKDFLSQFSRLLISQVASNVPEQLIQTSVNELLGTVGTTPAPVDVRLEFKHICKHTGCSLEDCQLCRNNPSKVCDDSDCFDHQYWVRDDSKGGQLIKAKCGADVALQLIDRSTNTPVYLPDVKVKLYVINGQQLAATSLVDPPLGLYLSDDGSPLFAAANATPEEDKGVPIELSADERLGPVASIPEFQFLNKNSKFKVGGRTFKCFKLLARATRKDPVTGQESVVAQVESESFKVTTKKGYDGCRKAEYLYAHDPITDKTFANLGETTITNLKNTFDGIETVEDLMHLVQACRSQPDMEMRLREVLNMARDAEKYRNLTRMLTEKVVYDDSVPRIFVVPNASRPLGLLFRANKGQVDFGDPVGVLLRPPAPTGQLRISQITDKLQAQASHHLEALCTLALGYWRMPRHSGWALAPESPCWEDEAPSDVIDAFQELFGQGDPLTLVDMHLAAVAHMAAAATPFLQRSPGHTGASVTPPPSGGRVSGLGSGLNRSQNPSPHVGGSGSGGLGAWGTGSGIPVTVKPEDLAAAAAAGATVSGGRAGSGGTAPLRYDLNRGVSNAYDSAAVDSADLAAAAAAGYGQMGMVTAVQHNSSMPATVGGPSSWQATAAACQQMNSLPVMSPAAGVGSSSGLALPTLLNPSQFGVGSQGLSMQQLQQQQQQGSGLQQQQGFAMQQQQQQQQQGMMPGTAGMPAATASPFAGPGISAGLSLGLQQQQQQLSMGMYSSSGMPAGYHAAAATGMTAAPVSGGTAAAAAAAALQAQLQMQGGAVYPQGQLQMAPGAYGLQQQQQQFFPQQQQQQFSPQQQQQQQQFTQQQQQQFACGPLARGSSTSPMVVATTSAVSAGLAVRTNSATTSGLSASDSQQQQQQQAPSHDMLMLQQAIVEGWPAAQVKAVLDRMSDDELRVLVAQHPATAAGVYAQASGQGLASMPSQQVLAGVPIQQGLGPDRAAGVQQIGGLGMNPLNPVTQGLGLSTKPLQGVVSGVATVQAGMQNPGQQIAFTAGSRLAAAASGQYAAPPDRVGSSTALSCDAQQQQQQQQQQPATGAAAAAAALTALFADADGSSAAAAAARASFDVQLPPDQQHTASNGTMSLNFDSFGDHGQWGDLLENLRALSSSSGPKADHLGGNSMLTVDWIPDLLFRLESESQKGKDSAVSTATATAAAAANGAAAASTGAAAAGNGAAAAAADQAAAAAGPALATAAAAAAAASAAVTTVVAATAAVDDADDDDRGPGRKAKRERSKTGQAPTAEQLAQLQAMLAYDPSTLRSLSKGQHHFGSFNRHFPVARISSQVDGVAQGAQVSNPWQPGLPMSASGVPTGSDQQQQPVAAAAAGRPAITTQPPAVTSLGTSRVVSAGQYTSAAAAAAAVAVPHTCPRITEEGAAAVAAVTGPDQPLLPVDGVEAGLLGENPSAELLHVLGFLHEEGYNNFDSSAAAATADGGLVDPANHVTGLAAVSTPFGVPQSQPADAAAAAAALLHTQPVQRTNSGKLGWISGLFRSGSSWSSKSSSLKGNANSQIGSGGSHNSRDSGAAAAAAAAAGGDGSAAKARGRV